jgi:hypothetical protein
MLRGYYMFLSAYGGSLHKDQGSWAARLAWLVLPKLRKRPGAMLRALQMDFCF